MKKILFIAPDSFPINGAESIVNVKLLAEMTKSQSFSIDLISKRSKHSDYSANTLPELGIRVNSINIIEVDNKLNLKTIAGHLKAFFLFGTVFKGIHWASKALKIAEELCKKNHYDYIITKNASAPLLGCYIKRKYKLKWVATWNDPYPHSTYPKIYADYFGAKFSWMDERTIKIIRQADIHIFPSKRLRDYMIPYYKIDINQTRIIPHITQQKPLKNNKSTHSKILKLIHSGNLEYPRDPEVFLRGLSIFVANNPDANVEFTILGKINEKYKEIVSELHLQNVVKYETSTSYKNSLLILKNYDIALIIEAKLDIGIFLPTKVSDYMQENIPIIAVSPSVGVLNDLYVNGNIGYYANNESAKDVYNTLEIIYKDFKNCNLQRCIIPEAYKSKSIMKIYSEF